MKEYYILFQRHYIIKFNSPPTLPLEKCLDFVICINNFLENLKKKEKEKCKTFFFSFLLRRRGRIWHWVCFYIKVTTILIQRGCLCLCEHGGLNLFIRNPCWCINGAPSPRKHYFRISSSPIRKHHRMMNFSHTRALYTLLSH